MRSVRLLPPRTHTRIHGALPLGSATRATWFHAEARSRGELPLGPAPRATCFHAEAWGTARGASSARGAELSGSRCVHRRTVPLHPQPQKLFDVARPRSVRWRETLAGPAVAVAAAVLRASAWIHVVAVAGRMQCSAAPRLRVETRCAGGRPERQCSARSTRLRAPPRDALLGRRAMLARPPRRNQ